MGFDTVFQQNNVGVTFIVTVVEEDGKTPQDISQATSTTIYLRRPDQSVISGSNGFVTDGTDGQIYYISLTGDLGVAGIYKIQGCYMVGGNVFCTQEQYFLVEPNF